MTLKPQFSKLLLTLLIFVHSGAIACILMSNIPLILKLLLAGGVIFSLGKTIVKQQKITLITVSDDRKWNLLLRNGQRLQAKLSKASVVTRYLVILTFKVDNQLRSLSVPVFYDSQYFLTFQKLRQKLLL